MGYLTLFATIAGGVLAVAFTYFSWDDFTLLEYIRKPALREQQEPSIESIVAQSWKEMILKPEIPFKRVAVGVNGNVDLIVKGSKLLIRLDPTSNSTSNEELLDHSSLRSIKDLLQSFAYHHSRGAGGERHMESYDDFQEVIRTAKTLTDAEYFIGGNGALMAQKMAATISPGGKVLLGCPVGPVLKPLLHPNLEITDSFDVTQDEYHMILEFSKGESWNGRTSPIASRFIFSHDIHNSNMVSFEAFIASLDEFNPDLIVLSGFHLLESRSETYWIKRIGEIAKLLATLPRKVPIHVELASMANKLCVKHIVDQIFPLVDSVGLNEQELWLVCETAGGPHCSTHALNNPPAIPRISDVLEWMLKTFSDVPNSRLTRVHFHTLPYHLIVTTASSHWQNQASAVIAGTMIASTQACDDISVQPEKVELRIFGKIALTSMKAPSASDVVQFDPTNPIVTWKRSNVQFYMSPVLICRKPTKTVGLGDAISSAGLLYSEFV